MLIQNGPEALLVEGHPNLSSFLLQEALKEEIHRVSNYKSSLTLLDSLLNSLAATNEKLDIEERILKVGGGELGGSMSRCNGFLEPASLSFKIIFLGLGIIVG
ncbi:uncharacterized protein A4U43_C03F15960 [Asparagus officinalis]|uniref:Uncharacterized protein n=1 Tax=Asparagus officinalis TaxID=4686 RepID=A0A5P1FBC6_ASPOF|nr:uncharacterized protein A4U43_C03F15960 [Asparagus officinalis]